MTGMAINEHYRSKPKVGQEKQSRKICKLAEPGLENPMRIVIALIVLAMIAVGLVSLIPDFVRYMKIRSM